jgi:hypothetical protein
MTFSLVTTAPPCPTCEREVVVVTPEGGVEDRRFGKVEFEVMSPRRYFTLSPCGHEVRGYLDDGRGNIKEWRL